MISKRGVNAHLTVFLMVVTLLAAACGPFASSTDGDLDHNPDYLRARKAADSGDFRVAATLYDRLVRHVPDAGRAHLELGVLYDEKLNDPIAAIYHYNQFLTLEPNSERRKVVEGFIERAKLALAAKLPSSSVDAGVLAQLQADKATLMQDNAALRTRVMELERAATTPTDPGVGPVAGGTVEPPRPVIATQIVVVAEHRVPPSPPSVQARMHTVQKGDTLQSIALRYYGTRSGWDKIYVANRAVLPNKDQLKVGQQLLIP